MMKITTNLYGDTFAFHRDEKYYEWCSIFSLFHNVFWDKTVNCGPMKLKDRRHTTHQEQRHKQHVWMLWDAVIIIISLCIVPSNTQRKIDTHRRKFILFYHSLTFTDRSHNARDKSHAHIAHNQAHEWSESRSSFFVCYHSQCTHTPKSTFFVFRHLCTINCRLIFLSRGTCVSVCMFLCVVMLIEWKQMLWFIAGTVKMRKLMI